MLYESRLTNLTSGEQERNLWRASQKYVHGEISREDLEEIESPHIKDVSEAIIRLSTDGFIQRVQNALGKLFED